VTISATLEAYRRGVNANQVCALYRQVLELRELLEAVASELGRLAGV
jgi:hypothetical protein